MARPESRRLRELTEEVEECERICQQERAKLDRLFGDALQADQARCQFGATQLNDGHTDAVVECLHACDQVSRQLNIYLMSLEQLRKAYDTLTACRQMNDRSGGSQQNCERSVEDIVSPLWI